MLSKDVCEPSAKLACVSGLFVSGVDIFIGANKICLAGSAGFESANFLGIEKLKSSVKLFSGF